MKTLYISDLDGTLLNREAEISDFTKTVLNNAISKGAFFSVATARTAATAVHMLSAVNINVPIILMNGVSVYDTVKSSYVKTHFIEPSLVNNLCKALKRHRITGFLYILENETLYTYYEEIYSEHAKRFIDERRRKYNKQFIHINDFSNLPDNLIVYFSVCAAKDALIPLYEEICGDSNLHIEFYHDIYEDGYWYLEVCSSLVSKYNAVKFLQEEYGFKKVVSFGDNLNDLPMFSASDESYAVENAKPEVKQKATAIIESNNDDGVAKWILSNY